MTKDVRTREGFNKFLRRSPLSGVNHTVIGLLEDISLYFLLCNYQAMSRVPLIRLLRSFINILYLRNVNED